MAPQRQEKYDSHTHLHGKQHIDIARAVPSVHNGYDCVRAICLLFALHSLFLSLSCSLCAPFRRRRTRIIGRNVPLSSPTSNLIALLAIENCHLESIDLKEIR